MFRKTWNLPGLIDNELPFLSVLVKVVCDAVETYSNVWKKKVLFSTSLIASTRVLLFEIVPANPVKLPTSDARLL